MNKAHVTLIIIFLIVGLTVSSPTLAGDGSSSLKAADFTLLNTDGQKTSLSDYRGKVIILDFWATWCPPCVKEIPHFIELTDEYNQDQFTVIGVSVDQGGPAAVAKFMKKTPVNYPILYVDQATFLTYQTYLPQDEQGGIPFTFILDQEGNIRQHYVGYRPKEVFKRVIDELLTENEG